MKKRLTKLLSFILAAAIAVSTVFMSADAESTVDYSRAISIMETLGMTKGLDTSNASASVRRDQFVASVVHLFGGEGYGSSYTFTDIENSEYKAEIIAAAELGFISGYNDNFNPDEMITYTDAVTILIKALGYSHVAESYGGYPAGYLREAKFLDLNDEIEVSQNETLTTGVAAQLLLNAGTTPMQERKSFGSDTIIYDDDDTPFWLYHGIGYGNGVLEGNQYTTLTNSNGVGANMVKIGEFKGEAYMNNAVYDYIGYSVDYFYQYDKNKKASVVKYIAPDDAGNEITEVKAEDIIGYSGGALSYTVGDKEKETVIPKNASVIYNGKLTVDYTDDDGNSYFEPADGYVQLISNDRDSVIDVVIIRSYTDYVIKTPTADNMIYDKFDDEKSLNLGELEGYTYASLITDASGREIRVEELLANDVLTVAESLDGKYMRAVLHREYVSGTITTVSDKDDKTIISVDGNSYTVSASCDEANIKLGTYGVFYLNYRDEIAGIDVNSSSGAYGYYFTARETGSFGEMSVRFMTAAGVIKIAPVAEKGTLDGNKWKTKQEFKELVSTLQDYQLMVYKLNGEGEFFYIDTADGVETGEGKLMKKGQKQTSVSYYNETKTFSTKILLNNRTNIFYAPTGDLKTDEDQYYVPTFSSVTAGTYSVQEYTTGSQTNAAECVVIDTPDRTKMRAGADFMLITGIEQTIDLDGDVNYRLTGWNREKEYSAFLSDDFYSRYEEVADDDARKSYLVSDLSTLEIGDFIKVATNLDGEITEICTMYYAGEEQLGPFYIGTGALGASQVFGNSAYSVFGELLSNDGTSLSIAVNNPASHGQADHIFTMFNNFTRAFRMEKNARGQWSVELVEEYPLAFEDYTHNGKSNKVLVYCYNVQPRMVLLYEE